MVRKYTKRVVLMMLCGGMVLLLLSAKAVHSYAFKASCEASTASVEEEAAVETLSNPDFSEMLEKMFDKVFATGNYNKASRHNEMPYLALETEMDDNARFQQYLKAFAQDNGFCYVGATRQQLIDQHILIKDSSSGRIVCVRNGGVRVIVRITRVDTYEYEISLTVWRAMLDSTSVTGFATVDSSTNDVSYAISGPSMS